MKSISNRPPTQPLTPPQRLRGPRAINHHHRHIPHLHLVHIAVRPRPARVLRRGVAADREQVADYRKPGGAAHARDAGAVAGEFVEEEVG